MKKLLVLAACMLLFGCVSFPITITESVGEVNLGADGSVRQVQTSKGPKTATAEDWPSDCTAKYKETMRGLVSMMQALGGMGGEMDAEQQAALANMTSALNIVMDKSTCSFQSNNGDGTLVMTMTFSYDDMQQMNQLVGGYAQESGGSMITMDRLDDGNYRFRMPSGSGGFDLTGSTTNEVRITVEGEVQSITPGYVEENGAYVYRNLEGIPGGMIEVVYTPKSSGFCGIGLLLFAGAALAFLMARKG